MRAWQPCIIAVVALCCLGGTATSFAADTDKVAVDQLDTTYRDWLREVAVLLAKDERREFMALTKNYERDLFIRRFWEARNPDPGSARNEFKDRWERRIEAALDDYGNFTEDRAVALLLHAAPSELFKTDCNQYLWPLEIWHYQFGERVPDDFYIVFYQKGATGPYKLWRASDTFVELIARLVNQRPETMVPRDRNAAPQAPELTDYSSLSSNGSDLFALARFLNINCPNDEEMLLNAVTRVQTEDQFHLLDALLTPAPPHDAEWLKSFRGVSTDLPAGSRALAATLDVKYPARDHSRTVVAGLVSVPAAAAEPAVLEGHRAYNLMLTGEVLRGTELAESFRYRYDLPAAPAVPGGAPPAPLPLAFERNLAPGEYVLVLRVEDLHSHHNFHIEQPITVPPVDGLPDVTAPGRPPELTATLDAVRRELAAGDAAGSTGAPGAGAATAATTGATTAAATDAAATAAGATTTAATGAAGAAATTGAAPAAGGALAAAAIRLTPPSGERQVGAVRLEAQVSGAAIHKVTFFLDGKEMLSRVRAPYTVELTLGETPLAHEVRAIAYGRDGGELASDSLLLNPPPQRFTVRLIEPRVGGAYHGQVLARAEVHVPDGGKLDRLEIFVDDRRLATLYQAPWTQMVSVPAGGGASYVRAVGYLADGSSSEALAVINSHDVVEALDVRLVELYASVVDRSGHPVDSLRQDDFKVLDGGTPQTLLRFEQVRDRPLQLMFVLDTSASMSTSLPQVQKAALTFLRRVVTPRDRAALLTFSDTPVLRTPFTNDLDKLAGALAGLNADRGTALFDSLVYALSYMKGADHTQSALVLFTDGDDHISRLRYDETLAYARRSGIALYTIGAQVSRLDLQVRAHLTKLAEETGGRSFFIESAADLDGVYATIENELRSRYLLAYQPSAAPHQGEYRSVDVKVAGDGLKVKTQRGYYP